MSNGIVSRQNEDGSIAMLAAQRQLYDNAKKFYTLSIALSVWLPFALSVALLFVPEVTAINIALYVVSIICTVSYIFIEKYIEEKKKLAAFIQQKFDTYVYTMPWNERIFGRDRNVDHEIAVYSKKILQNPQKRNNLRDWYTPKVDDKNIVDGILLCQRENLGWDVGLRKRFKVISIVMIVILCCGVCAMGLWKNEEVIELFCRIAFVAPMIKWLADTVRQLNKDISTLKELDGKINDGINKNMDDLQDIQKIIYEHRKSCYAIPSCVYRIYKNNDEDTAYREVN
ncbi:MAG: S-4TM family putative pore-forming effector [Lachnospiraceae bacterium]|nr:S-4TM family putative pore-forming effector [Lachnospiraceae bacterium]